MLLQNHKLDWLFIMVLNPFSVDDVDGFLTRNIKRFEYYVFKYRKPLLMVLMLVTVVMAFFALKLRMDAGFEKQLPIGHEYIQTFQKYRDDVLGSNRLTIVVKARKGSIWSKAALSRLYDVTQATMFLPNISRLGVQSLWTPNSFVNEITEEGFTANPLIPGTVTPDQLDASMIDGIRRAANAGGFMGSLVARDQSSAMIVAEINEFDAQGDKIDYMAYNHILEDQIRKKFEDKDYEIQIIGFAKQIGDIADGAQAVLLFCGLALLLTAGAVYWYCHSFRLTILPIFCSLTSLVWQFGTLHLLGYGLDPLAVLVPFLVFAIGVSHGVQQINFIARGLAQGKTMEEAARASFTGLLIPGTLALVTALVSFITLVLIPIPMVRELAITASIGVGYKIITNLIMLPIAASLMNFSNVYAEKAMLKRETRTRWLRSLARVGKPGVAAVILLVTALVFAVSVWQSKDRVVGTLQPGAPELRADSRYNLDAVDIAKSYDVGLDWLTVLFETSSQSCEDVRIGHYQDEFNARMRGVPGVQSVSGYADQLRTYNQGYNEGNPKMNAVPIDSGNYAALSVEIARQRGYMRKDCSMVATHLFLADHKAVTINRVVSEVKKYRDEHKLEGVTVALASGNAGVLAAINEEVEKSELPMMLYVYAAIVLLVFAVYRDFRAMIACCVPLTVATFIGYWFMKELQIGLTVATLPVMVLAVGIGVDYALYIYNRLQIHLANGDTIYVAMQRALEFEAMATVFTAITLAAGVVTWSFSELKFQADMGKLLAFMFMVNLLMSMTALPALAVWLERIFPRRKPVRAPGILAHQG